MKLNESDFSYKIYKKTHLIVFEKVEHAKVVMRDTWNNVKEGILSEHH